MEFFFEAYRKRVDMWEGFRFENGPVDEAPTSSPQLFVSSPKQSGISAMYTSYAPRQLPYQTVAQQQYAQLMQAPPQSQSQVYAQPQPAFLVPPSPPPPPSLSSSSNPKREIVIAVSVVVIFAIILSYFERLNTRLRNLERLLTTM